MALLKTKYIKKKSKHNQNRSNKIYLINQKKNQYNKNSKNNGQNQQISEKKRAKIVEL